ncbi:MAG: RNA polymerase sigma factor [Acidimicrobiia bacterium]|jgi:RNA polymerase sigma factor (sigma-70 family)
MTGDADPDLTRAVAEAQRGSVPAFERLYHALSPSVASYLRWNGVADVESTTNEVMAQVHRNLGRFSGDGAAFRSWVFTIAHHRMVDDRRARGRRPAVADGEIQETAVIGDAELDALDLLSDHQLRALIEQLSPDQRDVVLLRIVADLSIEDVAAALGKRRGAVKSLQHRALATLRRHLEREQIEP